VEVADAATLAYRPVHPYTRGLLASRPPFTRRLDHIPVIAGSPISASDAGDACPFVDRCPVRLAVCGERTPGLVVRPGGEVRCHRAVEIAAGELDADLPTLTVPPGANREQ